MRPISPLRSDARRGARAQQQCGPGIARRPCRDREYIQYPWPSTFRQAQTRNIALPRPGAPNKMLVSVMVADSFANFRLGAPQAHTVAAYAACESRTSAQPFSSTPPCSQPCRTRPPADARRRRSRPAATNPRRARREPPVPANPPVSTRTAPVRIRNRTVPIRADSAPALGLDLSRAATVLGSTVCLGFCDGYLAKPARTTAPCRRRH